MTDAGGSAAPEPMRFVVDRADGRSLTLSVFDVGLACCAVEFDAAVMRRQGFIEATGEPAAGSGEPASINVMVISGTVTDKMAPAIKRRYDALPAPKRVISFGSCANSGGPYWDSYSVTKGVDQMIPVDIYVPGCPPRPEALLHGVELLQAQLAAESESESESGSASGSESGIAP